MTFILEKISPEDIKKYNLESKLISGSSRKSWAIDRERGVFLIKPEKVAMGVGRYELHYQNLGIVNFDAEERAIGNDGNAFFKLDFLIMPISLKDNLENIKNDVVTSLKKLGYFADPKDINIDVKVDFCDDSKIFFKQGE